MAIPEGYKRNFETLRAAMSESRRVCLVECRSLADGKPVFVVCALNRPGNGMTELAPLAKMFDGDPYEELIPPGGEEV